MSSGADPAILFPLLFLVGLTALVWLWMYVTRVREIRSRRLRIQDLASARAVNEALSEVAGPSDNLINLFEIPVLFYVLVTLLYVTAAADTGYLVGAWAFVVLRALHSLIHTSYNRVMHRFPVYVLSTLVLWGMWARFAWYLLSH